MRSASSSVTRGSIFRLICLPLTMSAHRHFARADDARPASALRFRPAPTDDRGREAGDAGGFQEVAPAEVDAFGRNRLSEP